MQKNALVWVCLACTGHAHRLQINSQRAHGELFEAQLSSDKGWSNKPAGVFNPSARLAMLLLGWNPPAGFSPSSSAMPLPEFTPTLLGRSPPLMNLVVPESVENNPIFLDEKAKLAEKSFKIPPDQLILLAKQFLASRDGVDNQELLSEDFKFVGPIIGPLTKGEFLEAVGGVDIKTGFPDFNQNYHAFHVDPFEGNRVWYIARALGTNTGPFPPFAPEPTNKTVINPPQACSLTFDEQGLVTKYTIGYVIDREVGNTGGLGGFFGLAYGIGKPLPFPEGKPFKKSKRYRFVQFLGDLASRFRKK